MKSCDCPCCEKWRENATRQRIVIDELRASVEREAAFVRAAKAAFAARAALDPHSSEYPAQVDHLTALTDEAALAYRALALEREA